MTRAELIASLVPSVATGRLAHVDIEATASAICDDAEHIADEMIRRGIVTVSDAPKEGNA